MANAKIEKQERITRRIFTKWLDQTYSATTHIISATPVEERYDLYIQYNGKDNYVEVKQFFKNPEDFDCNIIKKDKYDAVLSHASGQTDQAIYIIRFWDKIYLYNLSKIPQDDIEVKPLLQKVTEFDDNSPMAYIDTCFIPRKYAKKLDISAFT